MFPLGWEGIVFFVFFEHVRIYYVITGEIDFPFGLHSDKNASVAFP